MLKILKILYAAAVLIRQQLIINEDQREGAKEKSEMERTNRHILNTISKDVRLS